MKEEIKYIRTHKQLLECHGKKVTCKINGEFIDDAMISCDSKHAYLCQNKKDDDWAREMFEYKYAICISYYHNVLQQEVYEDNNAGITEIQLRSKQYRAKR